MPDTQKLHKKLRSKKLVYSSNKTSGILRQRAGRKFSYYQPDGARVTSEKTLSRIEGLAIPPAWKNVWISKKKNTHLQATGTDERGRTQYIYHRDWIKICQENKFSKMVDFGLSLPKIREKVKYDLSLKKLEKRKIIATIVWLLEHTFIRVGGKEYSENNNSFGLTTLRTRHVELKKGEVVFKFRGKSGVFNTLEVSNPTIVKTIKKCIELPGYELFQFFDDKNERHVVDSQDINSFLKEVTNDDFSAKDFRTWGGTSLSANDLYKNGKPKDKTQVKKIISKTVKEVAKHLNNTVKVCKSYYIHPTVFETYEKEILVPHFAYYAKGKTGKDGLAWDELALVRLLQNHS